MSEIIPENMDEIQQKMITFQQQNKTVNEDEFIEETVNNIFQAYLDGAEDGHYDTCRIVNHDTIQIFDIMKQKTNEIKSKRASFVEDFKNDSFELRFRLEGYANEIAKN